MRVCKKSMTKARKEREEARAMKEKKGQHPAAV